MIPSRALVLLALGPLGLSIATVFDRSLVWPMILTDVGIVLIALVDLALAARPLVGVQRDAPAVFSVGRPNVVTLRVRSTARRALAVQLRDDLFDYAQSPDLPARITLGPKASGTVRYHVRPTRRGAYELGDHYARYLSPIGLWIRQVRCPARSPVKIYPDVQAVRTYELLARRDREMEGFRTSRRRGGESEFERLREYRREDEYRSIDWKATARRQKLIAREYQLESNQTVLFLLDAGRLMTAETLGLSLFDHALNATLMLSHVAARGGDQVGLLAFADTIKAYASPARGGDAARRIIQAGYDLHPELVETDYRGAFEQVSQRVKKRSLVVVFTQVVDELAATELLRLARGLLPRHLPLMVLLRDVQIDALVKGAVPEAVGLEGTAPYLRGAAAEIVGARDRLLRAMKKHGALVLDAAPAQLTPALINRYLEIKARRLL